MFDETQVFRQPQLWIPMVLLLLITVGVQLWVGTPRAVFGLTVGIMAAVYGLVFMSRLETKVSPEGLLTRFFPLEISFRVTAWDDIVSAETTAIKPMSFGGWGLRLGRNSKAYIISGVQAVKILTKDGKTLIVGTREPEKLQRALESKGR